MQSVIVTEEGYVLRFVPRAAAAAIYDYLPTYRAKPMGEDIQIHELKSIEDIINADDSWLFAIYVGQLDLDIGIINKEDYEND